MGRCGELPLLPQSPAHSKARACPDSLGQVVQWLRLHASNTGGLGSILALGTRSHMHNFAYYN